MSRKSHKPIEVNSVSLANLKAEIARRQIEVRNKATTLNDGCTVIHPTHSSTSSNSTKSIFHRVQNSLKSAKQRRDEQQNKEQPDVSAEEQAQWDQCRRTLEAKAKLYDALQQAGTIPLSNNADEDKAPLVDFERKAMERGSTYNYDYNSSDSEDDVKVPEKRAASPVRIPEYPVTYAHLRKGEIRDHGVGFYGFSEDADERAREMAALRELRKATEKARVATEQAKTKRRIQMAQRLAKLRARKGLPDVAAAAAKCLGEFIDTEIKEMPTANSDADETETPDVVTAKVSGGFELSSNDLDIASMLRRLRDEAESVQQQQRYRQQHQTQSVSHGLQSQLVSGSVNSSLASSKRGREWDRGKMALPAQHFISAGKQRLGDPVRDPEFAPPSYNQ